MIWNFIRLFSSNHHTKSFFTLVFVFCGLGLLLSACQAARPFSNTSSLQTIRVVMDNNYPPYAFLDSTGHLQGISVDQWRLWEKKTGIKVELTGMDWGEALNRMEAGEFDVIDTIFTNERRVKIFDFTRPYAKINVAAFFTKNISGINDAGSLKGFAVAVKSGDATIEYLKSKGIDQIIEYNSYEAIVTAAKEQKVNVFVADLPPSLYFLYKLGIQDQFNHSAALYGGEFHRAVRKGSGGLLPTVEQGFALISQDEFNEIDHKWLGESSNIADLWEPLGIAGAGILLFLLFLVGWNYSLRRRVTKRTQALKQVVDQLTSSEQKYRQLVANLPGVVYRCAHDSNWTVSYVSDVVAEMFGYSPKDLVNQPDRGLLEIIASSDQAAAVKTIEQNLTQSGKFAVDYRMLTAGGSNVWVSNRGQAVFNTHGGIDWIDGVIFDITERKSAEQSLRESEERLRATIDSMDDLLFVYDIDRRITEFYYSIDPDQLYRQPEDTIGKTMEQLEFSQEILDDFNRVFDLLKNGGPPQSFDYVLQSGNKNEWYNARLSRRLDENGNFAGVTSVIRNITASKIIEQSLHKREEEAHRFSDLLADMTGLMMELSITTNTNELFRKAVEKGSRCLEFDRMGIWLLDAETPPNICGTFGIDENGQVRDERKNKIDARHIQQFFSLFSRETPLIYEQNVNLMDGEGNVVGRGDHATASLWDGEMVNGYITVDNLMSQRAIDDQHKEAITLYAQVVGHLYTLKKTEAALRGLNLELEQRVEQRTRQLETSYQEMQSFSYSISHDLRAPLRAIGSFSQILYDDYSDLLDDQGKDHLNRIQAASFHMTNLMDALLKLARISRSELQMVRVQLSEMAEDVAANLVASQPDRNVEMVIASGLVGNADPALIRVVLESLLGNAWKFTSRKPDARIELGEEEIDGKRAFFVRDNGVGFDMSYVSKLFGPFQRLHSTVEFEGTGIGLAIVQRIIQRHGGEIWAVSTLGQGATFYFTLH